MDLHLEVPYFPNGHFFTILIKLFQDRGRDVYHSPRGEKEAIDDNISGFISKLMSSIRIEIKFLCLCG